MKKARTIALLCLVTIGAALIVVRPPALSQFFHSFWEDDAKESFERDTPKDRVVRVEIVEGITFSELMEDEGMGGRVIDAIVASAKDVYDLANIRAGRAIDVVYDAITDESKRLVYQINSEEELTITRSSVVSPEGEKEDVWTAERRPIVYEVKTKSAQGTIDTSLYEAALAQGIDERAIIALADVFQWSVDFALDVRTGDYFSFIYEERYRDGEYVMPGEVLAAKFINDGTEHYAFYFKEDESREGHYDEEGNSVQKEFLKAPVAFKYISSGYTTSARYVAAFQQYNPSHRAIDYAADIGTPVRAVGAGTVVAAGWNGSYGNFIAVRHNATYTTNYAHLSRYAVKRGQAVVQGQTIGYVGSTGYSTGPHLHYEMVKNGVKINPLREELPPGEPISGEQRERFMHEVVEVYMPMFDAE